jgi:hypothetical protein
MARRPDTWSLIDDLLAKGMNVGLYGPPGTGKTHRCTRSEAGKRVYNVTVTPDTPAAELRGHFVPKGEEFVWMHGPGARAWQDGARLVINEVNRAGDDLQTILYALFDDPNSPGTYITLPTGEDIRPSLGFQGCLTMNGTPDELEEALVDRAIWIEVNEVNPDALKVLPDYLRDPARDTCSITGDRRISIRRWLRFHEMTQKGMAPNYAAFAAFGERFNEVLDVLKLKGAPGLSLNKYPAPSGAVINNPNFDPMYSSWEDIRPTDELFCGWCQEDSAAGHEHADDNYCRAMRFSSREEWLEFCRQFSLSTEDTEPAARMVREYSTVYRTRSKTLDPSMWDLTF